MRSARGGGGAPRVCFDIHTFISVSLSWCRLIHSVVYMDRQAANLTNVAVKCPDSKYVEVIRHVQKQRLNVMSASVCARSPVTHTSCHIVSFTHSHLLGACAGPSGTLLSGADPLHYQSMI